MKNILNKKSSIPLKEQLQHWLQSEISKGTFKSGDKIPSINEISREMNIARETVRGSFENLIQKGLLIPEQGKGYFVKAKKKHLLRIGILGRLDGVYLLPVYQSITEALKQDAQIFVCDTKGKLDLLLSLVQNLAYQQSVDCLLVVPPRGEEKKLQEFIQPFRRYFKVAWLDRAPSPCKDAVFICDYSAVVDLALDSFQEEGIEEILYYSLRKEDKSVFSIMRKRFRDECERRGLNYSFCKSEKEVKEKAILKKRRGLLAETDSEALSLQARLLASGVKIPKDFSLLSCDNTPLSELAFPTLSSIDPGYNEIGVAVADWLQQEYPNCSNQKIFQVKPKLIQRQSSGNVK